MQNEKQAVARNSMIASGLLATGKFVAGIFTGSIGLISEGIHSFTDFIATSITWLAVRISDKPADDDHHFGHGKVENLAALFEVLLLLGAPAGSFMRRAAACSGSRMRSSPRRW